MKSDCILWWGGVNKSTGYGRIVRRSYYGRLQMAAHRMAWEECFGEIPEGMGVLHKCDVPRCVNPEHLFLGTQKENMVDCAQKGRIGAVKRSGVNCPTAKLNPLAVELIRNLRSSGYSCVEIARRFAVHRSTVLNIVNRATWR